MSAPHRRSTPRPAWRALLLGLCIGLAAGVAAEPAPPYAEDTDLPVEAELPDIGDSAGAIISPEQERQLGASTMRQLRRMAPIVTDEEVEDYIQKLGMELGKHANYYGDFHFFVIESPVINAFAVPGGYIGVHSGLILNSKSESEVASVLAHEISHLTQRHGARMIEAASNMSIPSMAAFLGAILVAAIAPQAGMGALAAVGAAQQQYQINFTRANEKEADRIGIELLHESGFRTMSMADFFGRLERANRYSDPKMIPEYLRTHPVTVNRIAEARERAERMHDDVVREDSYEYQLVWHKLNVMAAEDPNQARNYYETMLRDGSFQNESAARYGYALALIEARDLARARIEIGKLLAEQPRLPPFRLLAAKLEQEDGHTAAALKLLKQLHADEPDNRAACYTYVALLNRTDRPAEAKRVLRDFGVADEREPRFYKLLAEAEERLGDQANSHYNLAEYYRSMGELELAFEQLRLAQVVPDLSHYQRLRIDARIDEIEKDLNRLDQDRAKRREREERRQRG
ncbi:MAG TPA: M48 family metalloprotease [Gammaproteobacteria bacterium]|nr:M48 family metalloprotease [Gammaproteobacteria bacterium]